MERNLNRENDEVENLKERLDNLKNELETVKKSQNQKISYKAPEKKELNQILDSLDKRKNKKDKSEGCSCRCLIY